MERVQLEATIRKELGKGPSRRLRKRGWIPAVVYSPRSTTLPIAVESSEMKKVLTSGENILVDLKIRGGRKVQNRLVMVKQYDLHPVQDHLRHVDLYEVSLEEKIQVEVSIDLVGEPPGVLEGGILSPLVRTLTVSCLPEGIPETIEVDCSSLNIGDTIHVSDLSPPEDLDILTDPSTAVVTVTAPAAEERAEEAEEAEAEAGAEPREEEVDTEGEPES